LGLRTIEWFAGRAGLRSRVRGGLRLQLRTLTDVDVNTPGGIKL
jgi:hypothetical protein